MKKSALVRLVRLPLLALALWLMSLSSHATQIINLVPQEQFPGYPCQFEVIGGLPPGYFVLESSSGVVGTGVEVWASTDGFTSKFYVPKNTPAGKYRIRTWDETAYDQPVYLTVLKPSPPAVIFSVTPATVKPGETIVIRGMQFDDTNVLLFKAWSGQKSEAAIVRSINGTITTTVPSSLRPGYFRLILDNRCGNLSQEEVYIYIPETISIDAFYYNEKTQSVYVASPQMDGRLMFMVVSDLDDYYFGKQLPTEPALGDWALMVKADRNRSISWSLSGLEYGWKLVWLYDPALGWSSPQLIFRPLTWDDAKG